MNTELPFPVSVEIKGIAKPATFAKLPAALDAICATLAQLPLDDDQAACLAEYFAPASADRIADQAACLAEYFAPASADRIADQAACLAEYFAPASADRIADQLLRVGLVSVIAFLGIDPHPIHLRPAS